MSAPNRSDLIKLKTIIKMADNLISAYSGLSDETKKYLETGFKSDSIWQLSEIASKSVTELKSKKEADYIFQQTNKHANV